MGDAPLPTYHIRSHKLCVKVLLMLPGLGLAMPTLAKLPSAIIAHLRLCSHGLFLHRPLSPLAMSPLRTGLYLGSPQSAPSSQPRPWHMGGTSPNHACMNKEAFVGPHGLETHGREGSLPHLVSPSSEKTRLPGPHEHSCGLWVCDWK